VSLIAIDATVQSAVVTTVGTVVVALVGVGMARQSRTINEARDHAQEARDQVANTHSTNLRDDLDRVIAGLDRVLAGQERHEDALQGLRQEIAHERIERLAVAERLDDHVAATSR
jgi:hypothetical protein